MQINADLTQRAIVHSDQLPWVASPAGGVERRMLERDGGEVARATSVVRFAPDSRFPTHEHGGGEEFLVLDGTFSDEEGDFAAGWYVRNPPGTRHAPASAPGCTILVKLRQMAADDRAAVRIDTRSAAAEPVADSVRRVPLFESATERVLILELGPGSRFDIGDQAGGFETFVLEGTCTADADALRPGSWLRSPAGRPLALASRDGCRLFVKTGHLRPAA